MFESGRFSFFFPKFLSLVSFFRVRLGVRVRLGLGFELSSPIVCELVLSLTRLSFPLARFRHNPDQGHVSKGILEKSHINFQLIQSIVLLIMPTQINSSYRD